MIEIITTAAVITGVSIKIERTDAVSCVTTVLATESRPATLADADTFLAVHSLGRVGAWELDENGGVAAEVRKVDNRFNGTVAARLWEAVGTTHEEWDVAPAGSVQDGDLISDMDISEPYVVAGSRRELDTMRVHMVRDGGTWDSRHTAEFDAGQLVQVARKR
jgi:hypothetical protein